MGLDCTVFHILAHYHSEDQCSSYEKSSVVSMAFQVYKKLHLQQCGKGGGELLSWVNSIIFPYLYPVLVAHADVLGSFDVLSATCTSSSIIMTSLLSAQ